MSRLRPPLRSTINFGQAISRFPLGRIEERSASGSYASHFRYDTAIGYQTAIVGIEAGDAAARNQPID